MINRKVALVLCASILAGLALIGFAWKDREPEFQGRTLSEWMRLVVTTDKGTAERKLAENAIREIGTNAIPPLLEWIEYETPRSKSIVHSMWNHTIAKLDSDWRLSDRTKNRTLTAHVGFRILGENAAPAIPALERLLRHTNDFTSIMAAASLGHIGVPAVPVVMKALTDTNPAVRMSATLYSCPALGTNAYSLVQILIDGLQSSDPLERAHRASVLAILHLRSEITVPALQRQLVDVSPLVRSEAARGLGKFAPHPESSILALQALLTDSDEEVREAVTNALKRLSPVNDTN